MFILLGAKDCVQSVDVPIPVATAAPLQVRLPTKVIAAHAPREAERVPHIQRTMRLYPDAHWEPSTELQLDLDDVFLIPGVEWPDRPAAQALLADGDNAEAFLRVAEAEGLLDQPPSAYDDEWDRYVALWAMYHQLEWATDQGELAEQIELAYARTPDGPTTDALALGLLLVVGDADPQLSHTLSMEMLESGADELQPFAVAMLLELPNTRFDEVAPWLDSPETLRLGLTWALQRSDRQAAEQLAASLRRHPDSTEADRHDATDVVRLMAPAPGEPWWLGLSEEIRRCADLVAGETVIADVAADGWHFQPGGPAADCLQGWSFEAPEMTLEVRITN